MIVKNVPTLYIGYRDVKANEFVKLGPFFTASPDGYLAGEWITYKVQTESLNFTRVTVPWHHTITGTVER